MIVWCDWYGSLLYANPNCKWVHCDEKGDDIGILMVVCSLLWCLFGVGASVRTRGNSDVGNCGDFELERSAPTGVYIE